MTTRRVLLGISATALAVAGCSSAPKPRAAASAAPTTVASSASAATPNPASEPKTYEAVKAAAGKIEAAAMAHDGGTGWDMLTAAGQATMSRDDYVKVVQGCPKLIASNTVLSIALDAGGSTAAVKVSAPPAQGGQPFEWSMIYEAGHWKHQPSDGAMNWMRLGADKALTVLRDGSYC